MNRPRIGVVGYGHLGRHHARLLAEMEDADFVAIADQSAEALTSAGELHDVELCQDYRSLVGKVDADTYVLSLPLVEGQLGLALLVFIGFRRAEFVRNMGFNLILVIV